MSGPLTDSPGEERAPQAGAAAPAAVEFAGVTLAHGRRRLVEDASFGLAQGAFVGLFGANGAGKTTLMRSVLGLERPRAGRITVFDAPARPGRAGIGILPQQRQWPAATLDLAAIALLEAAHPGQGPAIGAALDLVDGQALARRRLGALSGGERQRLLLAQALVGAPRLLLLDEPLAGLDPGAQVQIVALIDRIRRQLEATVLFIAHDLNPLLGVMDAALWIAARRVRLDAPAALLRADVLDGLYGARMQVISGEGRVVVVPAC